MPMSQRSHSLGSNDLKLWHLLNPVEVAACGSDAAIYHQVHSPDELSPTERPLLFLHGANYMDATEVIRDLVYPFLCALLSERSQSAWRAPIYFVSWNSALIPEDASQEKTRTPNRRLPLSTIFKEITHWNDRMKDLESRASKAGLALSSFVQRWTTHHQIGPTVISHSLGARVWAETLKAVAANTPTSVPPGIWWNLQPALSRNAFTAGGEYEIVRHLYNGDTHAKTVVWYSRLDFVLSTLFLLAKKSPALGQFGCSEKLIAQRDVTLWAREAHGMNHIQGSLGSFFRRTAALILLEAENLGIVAKTST